MVVEDANGNFKVLKAPLHLPPNQQQIFNVSGNTGRKVFVTPDNVTEVLGLEKESSILAVMDDYESGETAGKTLFKTMWGAQYEFKTRWEKILKAAAQKVNPDLIKRVTITEDAIAFNKMKVATLGILGGNEDIRIEDIVNFEMLAKKFRNISTLQLDETIFSAAQVELGDPVEALFKKLTKLQSLVVFEAGYGNVVACETRQNLEAGKRDAKTKKLAEKTELKNQIEVVAAAKNKNLKDKSPGYQNKVWNACKGYGGRGWEAAGDALLEKNPRLFKAGLSAVVGTFALAGGAIFGIGGWLVHSIRHR